MKGLVFSEFIEFVEDRFSPNVADEMIEASNLPSQGAYTAVGTYHHNELLALVTTLSRLTDTPIPDLVQTFGKHLFGCLASGYPGFLEGVDNSFDFLQLIENHIHVEVRKLYPDAELPSFEERRPDPDHLILTYRSQRPFSNLARGLIEGCIDHFNEEVIITCKDLESSDGYAMQFDLIRKP
ncbi:MAG: heme NO-binding domain-containing protein [Candidatus Sedimenticola sp. (ex Thyasira tokunagai)]